MNSLKLIALVAVLAVAACSKGKSAAKPEVKGGGSGLTNNDKDGSGGVTILGQTVLNADGADTGLRVIVESIDLSASVTAFAETKRAGAEAKAKTDGETDEVKIKAAGQKAVDAEINASKNSRALRLSVQSEGKAISEKESGTLKVLVSGNKLDGSGKLDEAQLKTINDAIAIAAVTHTVTVNGNKVNQAIAGSYDVSSINLIEGDLTITAQFSKTIDGAEAVIGSAVLLSEKIEPAAGN